MKRIGGISISVFFVLITISNAFADQITQKAVFLEVRGGSDPSFQFLSNPAILALAQTADSSDIVTLTNTRNLTPPGWTLPYYSGWDLFIKDQGQINPSEWDNATYAFDTADGDPASCTIEDDGLFIMDYPAHVSLSGNKLSWSAVNHAEAYRIEIFPLANDGSPDFTAGPFFTDGPKTARNSLLPTSLPPGVYAVTIGSEQYNKSGDCQGSLLNRSRYSVKYALPLPAQSVPTMNQWGLIVFVILLAGSATWFIRRRKQTSESE